MGAARYKFRLGDAQHIMLRCDPLFDGSLRCRARARLGAMQWSALMNVSNAEIAGFIAAVQRVLATLSGRAELRTTREGAFNLCVSVGSLGAIRTDYEAWGTGARVGTQWHVSGSYTCWHQHYLTRLEHDAVPDTSVAN
jgi:hypothetical protein